MANVLLKNMYCTKAKKKKFHVSGLRPTLFQATDPRIFLSIKVNHGKNISRIQHARVNFFLRISADGSRISERVCSVGNVTKKIWYIVTSYSDTIGFTDGRTGSR